MPRLISKQTLIEERAKILAMVQFTSRDDLQASDFPGDGGLDLLVRIDSEGEGYRKFFGIQLKGTITRLPDTDRAVRYLRSGDFAKQAGGKVAPKYSFPVILLVFSMTDDKGYYAWSIEPIVNLAGEPRLRAHAEPSCAPFDRGGLKTIVDRVNKWHASLVGLLETA